MTKDLNSHISLLYYALGSSFFQELFFQIAKARWLKLEHDGFER